MDNIYRVIRAIFQDNVQKVRGIKAIYYGDPGLIPKDLLPAITIYPITATLQSRGIGSQGVDYVSHDIGISLVYDLRNEFNKKPEDVKVVQTMMETIFERDTSGNIKSDTIIGSLRTYTNMNIQDEVQFTDNYNITFGVNETREFPTAEAAITFTAYFRPQRQLT